VFLFRAQVENLHVNQVETVLPKKADAPYIYTYIQIQIQIDRYRYRCIDATIYGHVDISG